MANLRRDRGKERYWRRHVAQWRRTGQSVRDYCRGQELSEASFYAWRRVLAERARERGTGGRTSAASAERKRQTGGRTGSASGTPPVFVPVRVIEEANAAGGVEVVLCGGRVVRVSPGFAAETLHAVVAVLEGLPC